MCKGMAGMWLESQGGAGPQRASNAKPKVLDLILESL